MSVKAIVLLVTTAFAVIVLTACSDGAWEDAQKTNTIEAYQSYQQSHPQSHIVEVAEGIRLLRWEDAKKVNTIDAYQSFINEFPNSDYVKLANDNLIELSFNSAKEVNSKDTYQEFIALYPSSKYSEEITTRLETLYVIEYTITKIALVIFPMHINNKLVESPEISPALQALLLKYDDKVKIDLSAEKVDVAIDTHEVIFTIPHGAKLYGSLKGLLNLKFRYTAGEIGIKNGDIFVSEGAEVTVDENQFRYVQGQWAQVGNI